MQLHQEVRYVIDDLVRQNVMFTVYDVHRILENKFKCKFDYDIVRKWVRRYFENIFPVGWTNDIGYHLKYDPAPHIYAPPGADIKKYDPDALDPNKVNVVTPSIDLNKLGEELFNWLTSGSPLLRNFPGRSSAVTQPEYWYAAVDKKTGERLIPSSRRNGNNTGLYRNKNGPSQLLSDLSKNDYEIVKYEVTLKRVDN